MENKLENLHDVNKVMAIIKTLEDKKASVYFKYLKEV